MAGQATWEQAALHEGANAGSSLRADVVAAIDDLELAARFVVEGLRTGGNRSPFHGFSSEFRQHRAYRAGDDLKYLDWKLFARSGRLFTRQFRESTNLPLMLVLDTSASMRVGAAGEAKFRYAQVVAAALVHVACDQGNAVGIMTLQQDDLRYIAARGGVPHRRALIAEIDRLRPEGRWDPGRAIDRSSQLLGRRGMLIVISDFYDDEPGTWQALRRAVRHGHDATVLQLMTPSELDLRTTGAAELVDAESGARVAFGADVAAEYARTVSAFVEGVRRQATAEGIDSALMLTSTPPAAALRSWLHRRGGTRVVDHPHRPLSR